jgi:thioredoxin-like negative regulator of GroEL
MGILAKVLGLTPKKMPVSVDDESFDKEVRGSRIPVILDVWGPNCRPCKQLEPIMMQLAAEYDGRVKVCEMSTLAGPRTAAKLRVKGTPTVLYFQHGKEVERVTGMRGSLYHQETIEEVFGIAKDAPS